MISVATAEAIRAKVGGTVHPDTGEVVGPATTARIMQVRTWRHAFTSSHLPIPIGSRHAVPPIGHCSACMGHGSVFA